jgi:Glu-tRNA(Gln) amidotransferase subunit E-like FAD-binding protein
MARARKWSFEHANELENYSTLTAEDAARVQWLIDDSNTIPQKKEEAKAKAKQDAAQAKFEKAQDRANAKLAKAEARAAKKAKKVKKVEPEPEPEVDYSEVDAWTLEAAKSLKDEIRKAKARAYYQTHKEQMREYQRKYREAHPRPRKVVALTA